MRILLTNDDGVNARGMAVLEALARTFSDDVWIVAPAEEQSGKGRSLTITQPIRATQLGERRFAVTGTPTDAVMMALALFLKDGPPDLILSGVNRGANLAEDVSYSGTVAGAMEGALAGIPAVALSQVYARHAPGDDVSFATAEAWGTQVLRPLIEGTWEPRTLVNVNFPAVEPDAVRGIRVVPQGLRDYGRVTVEQGTDPRGYGYYWLAMGRTPPGAAPNTDLAAVAEGYISVTPLHLDLTHSPSVETLAARFA